MSADTKRLLQMLEYLQSESVIARRTFRAWALSSDPDVLGAAYVVTPRLWSRIVPTPDRLEFGRLVGRVLEMSLRRRGTSPFALTDYAAAREFMAWTFQCWADRADPAAATALTWSVLHLAKLYRRGSAKQRRALVDGAIEHFFEVPDLASHFKHWRRDPLLRRAHAEATRWANGADAHGNAVSASFLKRA
jgi:hypothetical protein